MNALVDTTGNRLRSTLLERHPNFESPSSRDIVNAGIDDIVKLAVSGYRADWNDEMAAAEELKKP